METERYKILGWHVTKAQGAIPEDGFKQSSDQETSDLMSTPMLGGSARKFSWSNRAQKPCSMSFPSDVGESDDVEVHFGDLPVLCRVELKRYGKLLVGAFTCGFGGPNDGNAGIFVAELDIPDPDDSV